MADVLTSNLYPPIIDTFMPAFAGDTCRVYFELSDFNTSEDIDLTLTQVTLKNQNTNENSLNNANGIRFYTATKEIDSERYYIDISDSDLEEGFSKGEYYKLQIRFTKAGTAYTGDPVNPGISWINSNLSLFSEWSSVCLIRKITEPTIQERMFVNLNGTKYESRILRSNFTVGFKDEEGEYLSEYKVVLLKDNTVIEESPIQYPKLDNDKNKVLYNFKKRLDPSTTYILRVIITTNNGYVKSQDFTFQSPAEVDTLTRPQMYVNASPQSSSSGHGHQGLGYFDAVEQGRMKIQLIIPTTLPQGSHYVAIYRSSSKTGFEDWEEIALVSYVGDRSVIFFDYAIESGVWYKYIGQIFNASGACGQETDPSEPQTTLYEDVFLNSQGKQLKLRYDSHVTSYKRTVLENKIETLGATYPIVRRNSNTNYKTFQISGLISYLSDDGEVFLTEDQIYGEGNGSTTVTNLYHEFNAANNIGPQMDYIKEREFREKVFDFLTSGKVFLLRTMTEGLTLVRLMDITFTPKQELNNYIYNFTATAVEIDKCSPENYYKYKVFPHYYSTIQLER